MAGSLDALQHCYTGLEMRRPAVARGAGPHRLSASGPSTLRGQSLAIGLEEDTACVNAMHCVAPSVRVAVNAEIHNVGASETRRFSLK